MISPPFPANERLRVSTLRNLAILDTPPEERFDRVTRLAQRVFNVPIALVSLIDSNRQWFKSCIGVDTSETPRDISFCGHAILDDEILLVPDAKKDERFADNPFVTGGPNIRFYAGYPLRMAEGIQIGTLCVIDTEPRHFTPEDLQLLRDLGTITIQELQAVAAAITDDLTGLLNRRGFLSTAGQTLELCRRTQTPIAMLYCDLDQFKSINDRYGHSEGDNVLRKFAQILHSTFRSSDVVARLGGDEFVVMLTNVDAGAIDAAMVRIEKEFAEFNRLTPCDYSPGCSLGVVTYKGHQLPELDTMIAAADAEMYAVKKKRSHGAQP